jgi:ABC-2 type transport system permease protein
MRFSSLPSDFVRGYAMDMVQIKDGLQSLSRIWAVGLRVIRQIKRDRRTMMTMVINPIILMIILGYSLSATLTGINLGVVDLQSGPIQGSVLAHLQASNAFSIVYLASESEARRLITDGRINGAVVLENGEIRLILDGTSPQVASTITANVAAGMQVGATQILSSLPGLGALPAVTTYYVYGYDLEAKDALGAALLGISIFFFAFLNTAIAFLRERTQGTLEKVLVSPLDRIELVSGYILGFSFVAIAQAAITFTLLVTVFGVPIQGSWLAILVIVVLLSAGSLSFGAFLSNFVTSEYQVMQLNPVVSFPQILLSGAWFPLQSIPDWLRPLAYIFPITYSTDALKLVLLKGSSLTDIFYPDVFALLLFFLLTFLMATFMLKKTVA